MSRSRYAPLFLGLGWLAGTACGVDLTGAELCLHSEGCERGGGWNGWNFSFPLSFSGLVTSAVTGHSLPGVAVRFDAPARSWTETALTDSTGLYVTNGLPSPMPGDCTGLSLSFSAQGYEPLRVTDFPSLSCGPGYPRLNARLTPTP